MFKFFSGFRKEARILLRDKAGLTILFIMPMVLIIIMSLLQEFGYSSVTRESSIKVLFLDKDQDTLGLKIGKGLRESNFFVVVDSLDGKPLTEAIIEEAVKKGDYLIGIVIPEKVTQTIRTNVKIQVTKTLAGFGLYNPILINSLPEQKADTVTVFFDPTVKKTFKNAIVSAVKEFNYKIETEMVFKTFNQEMALVFPNYQPPPQDYQDMVVFKELFPTYKEKEEIPNSAQHNVPSWAVFAMFFIIIPFTSSMMIEREEGSLLRLQCMPVSFMNLLLSKVFVYMIVCFVQTILMMITGLYLLPLFNAVPLELGHQIGALIVVTIVIALAALGFGLMVGTVATTHQQAASFGAVSIIIMAALGGLFVPMYLMSDAMKGVAGLSPLNWALTAYYTIFLRGGGLLEVFPSIYKLILFFAISLIITFTYRTLKNPLNK
ncbi:MAG TPA: ABC transporter permease [Bacteroidales bacterium]|nr:ABC transporter permease [Bacteroidales bacterium]HPT09347.1 ABC transporter permease [Bacteroidales bacterium]